MDVTAHWLLLEETVRETLQSAALWQTQSRVLVGVSGGMDSMALLFCLSRMQVRGKYQLIACHINHGLREASKEEQALVQSTCNALQIPCHVSLFSNLGTMHDAGVETRAREKRQTVFDSLMQTQSLDALCLAHHLDDQCETVLMHLCRGAGAAGLSGMKQVSMQRDYKVIRPFLSLSKQQIKEGMMAEALPYQEDESNAWLCTPRNVLRQTILPKLEALYPRAGIQIAKAAQRFSVDEDCLQQQARALFEQALFSAHVMALETKPLQEAHKAIVCRVLRLFYGYALAQKKASPKERALSDADTQACYELLFTKPGTCINLPCQLQVLRGQKHLHMQVQGGVPVVPMPIVDALRVSEMVSRYDLVQTTWKVAKVSVPVTSTLDQVVLPREWIEKGVDFRLALSGDVLHGYDGGKKTLGRLLINAKVDRPFRPFVPVLALQKEVLWVPDLFVCKALQKPSSDGIMIKKQSK